MCHAFAPHCNVFVYQVGNYVPLVWSPEINETVKVRAEARSCGEGLAPSLLILVQVEIASPFLEYFLSALEEQKSVCFLLKVARMTSFSRLLETGTPRIQRPLSFLFSKLPHRGTGSNRKGLSKRGLRGCRDYIEAFQLV